MGYVRKCMSPVFQTTRISRERRDKTHVKQHAVIATGTVAPKPVENSLVPMRTEGNKLPMCSSSLPLDPSSALEP